MWHADVHHRASGVLTNGSRSDFSESTGPPAIRATAASIATAAPASSQPARERESRVSFRRCSRDLTYFFIKSLNVLLSLIFHIVISSETESPLSTRWRQTNPHGPWHVFCLRLILRRWPKRVTAWHCWCCCYTSQTMRVRSLQRSHFQHGSATTWFCRQTHRRSCLAGRHHPASGCGSVVMPVSTMPRYRNYAFLSTFVQCRKAVRV